MENSRKSLICLLCLLLVSGVSTGCNPPASVGDTQMAQSPNPTATEVAPSNTPLPPTFTAVPPTHTPLPPTKTRIPPTDTPVPPTATQTAIPDTPTPSVPFVIIRIYPINGALGDQLAAEAQKATAMGFSPVVMFDAPW